ncbi:glycosyltransferase [Sphaerisporangium sp. NPDC088356]|uniref:glycosyltransferase n=1 Tax=Sphaerisporangium sp. NPDC088356 TaxID=3154871 RepID=UPI00342531E8
MYAIGLCVDEQYLLPSLVTLGALAETLSPADRRDAAVRILTLDLTRQHAATMAAYVARIGFGSFALRWARPSSRALMVDDDYITETAYLRFQFTQRFLDRPYLIYVDADTLPVDDITGPLEDLGAGRLGLVADEFNSAIGQRTALPGLAEDRPDLLGRPYYNSGMWWTSAELLATIRAGVETALLTGRRYLFHNDQDALNLWLLDHSHVQPVPGRYNTYELSRFLARSDWTRRRTTRNPHPTDTALLHFVGRAKPWLTTTPPTEHVRLYRRALTRTTRELRRLGDHSVDAQAFGRRS